MNFKTVALLICLSLLALISANADVVYTSITSPLPTNVASTGYEATSTAELGNAITLAGSARGLTTISVVMSNWAKESTYETVGTSTGYNHLLTLNLYSYNLDGSVGSLFGSETLNAFIAWRPEADGCDGAGDGFTGSGGGCYHGLVTTVTFDFTADNITLPDSLIFGLAYNTADYGANPLHAAGPYNSLNFGTEGGATVGSNIYADGAYVNSTWAGEYGDGGAGGTGTFRKDPSSWNGYSPEVTVNAATAVPEPGSMMLLGTGLAGIAATIRRRMKK